VRELGLATVKSSGSCDHSGGYGFPHKLRGSDWVTKNFLTPNSVCQTSKNKNVQPSFTVQNNIKGV